MAHDENGPGGLEGLRVMVIDDSTTIRRTAETLLRREGADVTIKTFSASDEVAAEVRAGRAVYRSGGRRTAEEDEADGAVFPSSFGGRVIGCLCVQGRSVFPPAMLAIFRAAAEAVIPPGR